MTLLRYLFLMLFLCCVPFASYSNEVTLDKERNVSPSFLNDMKQSKGAESVPGLGRIILSLFLVTVVAFLVVFSLKKIGYGGDKLFTESSLIKVLASKKLSVKSTMHLVDIDSAQYIVVEKENAVSIVRHSTTDIPDKTS